MGQVILYQACQVEERPNRWGSPQSMDRHTVGESCALPQVRSRRAVRLEQAIPESRAIPVAHEFYQRLVWSKWFDCRDRAFGEHVNTPQREGPVRKPSDGP